MPSTEHITFNIPIYQIFSRYEGAAGFIMHCVFDTGSVSKTELRFDSSEMSREPRTDV